MWKCTVFGHRVQFRAQGRTMSWACERCGQQAGSKDYPTPAEARHYAAALNHRDADEIGRRAPLLGMFPLRLWRMFRQGRR